MLTSTSPVLPHLIVALLCPDFFLPAPLEILGMFLQSLEPAVEPGVVLPRPLVLLLRRQLRLRQQLDLLLQLFNLQQNAQLDW